MVEKLRVLDDVITPDGIGRVEIVHPEGVLGNDGKAPTVKVVFSSRTNVLHKSPFGWYRKDQLKKVI